MKYKLSVFLMLLVSCFCCHYLNAKTLKFIEVSNTINSSYSEQIKLALGSTILDSITTHKESEITLSLGMAAVLEGIRQNTKISVASLLTQAQILKLTREYPQQLKDTIFVMSQAGYQCQMDLYKEYSSKHQHTGNLAVLLKNETRSLMPKIKQYAKKINIGVSFWLLYLNEDLANGLHYLFKNHQSIVLIASPEFNNNSQLPAILQEAKILHKKLIASSVEQVKLGISPSCVIKKIDLISTLKDVTKQLYKHQKLVTNYQHSDFPGFRVIVPKITTTHY